MPRKLKVHSQDQEIRSKFAAIYCRVSTAEQGQSGLSLKDQEERCRGLCVAKGWDVYNVYVDIASAGSLDRAEFTRLVLDAEAGKFNVVVALRLDRISRVPRDFYNVVHDFNKQNIEFTTVDNDIDTTTPQGRMLLGVLLQFAAFEREMGAERTRAAMRKRAAKGLPPGGVPPLGYNRVDGKFVIAPEEAQIVRQIFNSYVNGVPPAEIARELNRAGYRTKLHTDQNGKTSGGRKFTRNIITKTITNPIYTGVIYFSGENFPGLHEPIISKSIFSSAQATVKSNAERRNLGNPVTNQMLLNGLIKCSFCGSYMTTKSGTGQHGQKYYYYVCSKSIHEGAKACVSRQVKREDIEAFIVSLIRQIANDPDYLDAVINSIENTSTKDNKRIENEINALGRKILSLEAKQQNIAKAVSEHGLEDISGLTMELKDLQDQINSNIEHQQKLIEESKQANKINIRPEEITELYQEFDKIWDLLDKPDQRSLINLLIGQIDVQLKKNAKTGELTVHLNTGIPLNLLTEQKIGSSLCSVSLRRRDSNPQPSG